MIRAINSSTKFIYWTLITIVLLYVIVSIYSYYSVFSTFGKVPSSQDFTAELIASTVNTFRIFPRDLGLRIILAFIYSLGFVIVFIPLLLLVNYFNREIKVHKWLSLSLVALLILVLTLGYATETISWYTAYILD
jgi:hypothetical protein